MRGKIFLSVIFVLMVLISAFFSLTYVGSGLPTDESISVDISKPVTGSIYLNDIALPVIHLRNRTLIIGPITIDVDINTTHEINFVEFKVDNNSLYVDHESPYTYRLNERLIGIHEIEVTVNYSCSESVTKLISARFFNPVPRIFNMKGILEGKVVNSSGKLFKRAIPYANVTIKSINYNEDPSNETWQNLTTGKIPMLNRGDFKVRLSPGKYTVNVTVHGFKSYETTIDVRSMVETHLKIRLVEE